MNRRGAIAAAALLVVVAAVWLARRPERLNAWPIRNLPVDAGPILCFGDSLVEGVGASAAGETYPAQLGVLLGRQVVAHGVGGMTTQDGRRRLDERPALRAPLVVVTLGGNDILRRTALDETLANLEAIFTELQDRGCVVAYCEVLGVVAGKRAKRHRELCRRLGVILIPDVLDDILGQDDMISDSIHPNDQGYRLMAGRVAAVLEPFLNDSAP